MSCRTQNIYIHTVIPFVGHVAHKTWIVIRRIYNNKNSKIIIHSICRIDRHTHQILPIYIYSYIAWSVEKFTDANSNLLNIIVCNVECRASQDFAIINEENKWRSKKCCCCCWYFYCFVFFFFTFSRQWFLFPPWCYHAYIEYSYIMFE